MMVCNAAPRFDDATGTYDDSANDSKISDHPVAGSSSPEVTIGCVHSGHVGCSWNETFTAAILRGQTVFGEEFLPLLFSRGVEKLFYFLASLQVLMGAYLIWHALQWLGYVPAQIELRPWLYAPKAKPFCARCKASESGLERNLVSLTEFEGKTMRFFSSSLLARTPRAASSSAWPRTRVLRRMY